MPVSPDASPARPTTARWKIFSAALVLVFAGLLAYRNSYRVPFVHDDFASIVNNDTIQHGLMPALYPPVHGETVMGRPLVNVSFAANYSTAGEAVAGYHAVNLAIHLLAGLALFGLVRRTLELPSLRERWGGVALPTALSAALLWTLHPLQTEAVTYIAQRAESLAGLFYLLTFYSFTRALSSSRKNGWLVLSVLMCLTGVFCKETIVTAPVLLLLYDRAFAAGTVAAAWKLRWKYYTALLVTWIPLAALVINAGTRDGSAGFGAGVSPVAYALTQADAVMAYLRLCFWPYPQVFDYGNNLAKGIGEVAPQLALVMALLAGTIYLLWKKPSWGFLGAWFFVTLAPSSSIIPIVTETMAEHRMYLPLVAVAMVVALGLNYRPWRGVNFAAVGTLALALGWATAARNHTYRSALSLWADTVQSRPDVARAHVNYAVELLNVDAVDQSAVESRLALTLQPDFPEAESNLGNALARQGKPAAAVQHLAKATLGLRLPHEKALAYFNLGSALGQLHQYEYALQAYTQSTQLLPENAAAHNQRGLVLAALGRYDEAIVEYEQALQLQPDYAQCKSNLLDAKAQLVLRKL